MSVPVSSASPARPGVEPARALPAWVRLVERGRPLEVDIGCGKGKLLIARAQQMPDVDFLGLDRAGRWMRVGRERAEKRGLPNVAFVRTEARLFIGLCLPPARISTFHIYFPDPWPKRRHHKRRLITPGFLDLLHGRLIAGGRVEVATDDREYFEAMREVLTRVEQPWQSDREGVNRRLSDGAVSTNYELKYAAAGRALYYRELVKGEARDLLHPVT